MMTFPIDTAPATRRPRVGAVAYLNTLPLVEGLAGTEAIDLRLEPPCDLARLLESREVDVALASLVDYQRSAIPLELVPIGMIGCDGPTLTVRIYSRVPLDAIRTLHADVESHTSACLAQLVVERHAGRCPETRAFDAHPAIDAAWADGPEAVLLIGDKVVTGAPPASRYPHQIDLGEAWKARTGLPFVYALWMCRAGESPALRTTLALLDRQRRHNATRSGWIAAGAARMHGWPAETTATYLGDLLRFDPTPRHREAIDRCFDEAGRAGLIGERRPTRWAEI